MPGAAGCSAKKTSATVGKWTLQWKNAAGAQARRNDHPTVACSRDASFGPARRAGHTVSIHRWLILTTTTASSGHHRQRYLSVVQQLSSRARWFCIPMQTIVRLRRHLPRPDRDIAASPDVVFVGPKAEMITSGSMSKVRVPFELRAARIRKHWRLRCCKRGRRHRTGCGLPLKAMRRHRGF